VRRLDAALTALSSDQLTLKRRQIKNNRNVVQSPLLGLVRLYAAYSWGYAPRCGASPQAIAPMAPSAQKSELQHDEYPLFQMEVSGEGSSIDPDSDRDSEKRIGIDGE
jgi:hypothetical protein